MAWLDKDTVSEQLRFEQSFVNFFHGSGSLREGCRGFPPRGPEAVPGHTSVCPTGVVMLLESGG